MVTDGWRLTVRKNGRVNPLREMPFFWFIGEMRAETKVQSDKEFWRHDSDVQCRFRSEHG